MHQVDEYKTMFTVGGLPEGMTVLQRLQHLRLGNCITEPLACDLSQFRQLTSLEIPSDDLDDHDVYVPGPVEVRWSALTPVQCRACPRCGIGGCHAYKCWAQRDRVKLFDQSVTPDRPKSAGSVVDCAGIAELIAGFRGVSCSCKCAGATHSVGAPEPGLNDEQCRTAHVQPECPAAPDAAPPQLCRRRGSAGICWLHRLAFALLDQYVLAPADPVCCMQRVQVADDDLLLSTTCPTLPCTAQDVSRSDHHAY